MNIGGTTIEMGQRKIAELHLGRLYDFTELTLPVEVIRGKAEGPTLFLSGAIHGDELSGVAIIKKIIGSKRLKKLSGTLIAIPIVNVFGFNTRTRYLPDRRDLNRCFPGSPKGSLASRIAALFMNEIVENSDFGIDYHSGGLHRTNLPQIRTMLDDTELKDLAEVFGAPVILNSKIIEGSLRGASEGKAKILLFEGGEALRLDETVVRSGVQGAFAVMEKIGMLPLTEKKKTTSSYIARSSYWVRAPQSGMIHFAKSLGSKVKKGTLLGKISDAFGKNSLSVTAPSEGIVIGQSKIPLINRGDALYHIATFEHTEIVQELADDLLDFYD